MEIAALAVATAAVLSAILVFVVEAAAGVVTITGIRLFSHITCLTASWFDRGLCGALCKCGDCCQANMECTIENTSASDVLRMAEVAR